MKQAEDFRRAIGDVPPSFEHAVRWTVQGLSKKAKGKKHVGLVMALTLALALLMITAGLASVDRLDVWRAFWNWDVQPKAEQIFNTDVGQRGVQTDHAEFRVREAAYDGVNLYMTVEIRPRGQVLLIYDGVFDEVETMPIADLADCYAMGEGTVTEYAQRMGKQVVWCDVTPHLTKNEFYTYEAAYQEDGSILVLYGYGDVPRESLDLLEMTCQSLAYRENLKQEDGMTLWRETSLSVLACNIPQTASAVVACNKEPTGIVGFDLVVDDVRYVHSPLASSICFSVYAGESTDIEDYGISQQSFSVRWTNWKYLPEENRYDYWAVCEPLERFPEEVRVVIRYEPDQRYQGSRTVPLVVEE